MVSGPIVHVIATVALIVVLASVMLYSYINVNLMVNENLRNVFKAIAENYASVIRSLYEEKINNTIARINSPVEVSSKKYYNVYIGYGHSLSELFPAIRNDPGYNDFNIYVVVSTPDRTIYAYSRAMTASEPGIPPALLGKGKTYILTEYEGFWPWQGYSEGGLHWVCRLPINVREESGNDLQGYLVPITLDLTLMRCNYQGRTYTPSENDIRFTDSDGKTRLDYWIEYWDESSGKARVWVKLNISSNSTKTIFAYWGQALANSLSDPSIFIMYEDLDNYANLNELLITGRWHLKSKGVREYASENYEFSYSGKSHGGLRINATLIKEFANASFIIFSNDYFEVTNYGLIFEGLVAPFTLEARDVTFSIYKSTTEEALVTDSFKTQVYDYYTSGQDLSYYGFNPIWGEWYIDQENNVLVGINNGKPDGLPDYYKVAAIIKSNGEYTSQKLGQENFTFMAKLYIEPDKVYRGVFISDSDSIGSNTIGIGIYADTSQLKLVKTNMSNLDSQELDINYTSYSGWVYLKVSASGPGSAINTWDIYVYDEHGNILLEHHDGKALGGINP
ncbi:MAG: DUF2341 domain-containing protein, partial [Staphylothermus sp.]|nr:DUF2341 domain-containing protein [Staphylothermus sp.]